MIFEVALPVPVPKTFDYLSLDTSAPQQHLIGSRVKVLFGPRPMMGVVVGVKDSTDTPADRLKKILQVIDADPLLTEPMLELSQWLSDRYLCSRGEALDILLPPKAGKKESIDDPNVTFHAEESHGSYVASGFTLTGEQSDAIARVHDAVFSGPKSFLLRGVSAAGKTEVYISAINDVLSQGKSALYLAPEIGLVDHIAALIADRFGPGKVCVWHSGKTVAERRDLWFQIKRGDFPIVIGARSAALLPVSNLGLIVMDEEHDSAWKEDRKPRFHARDVVATRARLEKTVAIFGSATPSLELLFETKEGRVEMLEMNERAVKASAPAVRLIDMKLEKSRGVISPTLEKAIGARLAKKEQTILFINRRGFYRYLRCPKCDWTAKCPDCGVTLVEHKSSPRHALGRGPSSGKMDPGQKLAGMTAMVCHYCAKSWPAPAKCPECGEKKLKAGGVGTERVEEEIKEKFPWARVARWDRDSVKKRGSQEKILREFQNGNLDVIVGTQLVAQGFHFPKVTLVGVVNADTSLHIPDFRAAEHTFQLLMQVAGRAGRDLVTGEVLIQTRHADHPALQSAITLDYRRFSEEELKFRQDLFYPPFTHLIKIETAAKDAKKSEKDINDFVAWIMALEVEEPIGVLGPTPSKRKRKGISSFHILLKIPVRTFDPVLELLRKYLAEKSSRFRLDIDPI